MPCSVSILCSKGLQPSHLFPFLQKLRNRSLNVAWRVQCEISISSDLSYLPWGKWEILSLDISVHEVQILGIGKNTRQKCGIQVIWLDIGSLISIWFISRWPHIWDIVRKDGFLRKTQGKWLSSDKDSIPAHSGVGSHHGRSRTFLAFAMIWQLLGMLSSTFTDCTVTLPMGTEAGLWSKHLESKGPGHSVEAN